MLQLLRKYQSYIYILVTIVIVISFSFFGTYNSMPSQSHHEQIAFTAIDGTNIQRHDLDDLVYFLSTDTEDKRLFQGVWGPNFLNDGVIKHDFLESGLAKALVASFPDEMEKDLTSRHEKEKKYSLYQHPQGKFISVETVWSHFAPQMKSYFDKLRRSNNATDQEAFEARMALFLNERKLPGPLLKQFLIHQERQNNWLISDPTLEHADLSLYGYHTLEDWFGPRFLRLIAQVIINSSKVASEKGYLVTREEALADLKRNAEISFQENRKNPQLGVANSSEYFNEQLRRLGMDQNKAAKVWQQVLLFRKLFQDVGSSHFVDPQIYRQFYTYANEGLEGEIYQLPPDLRFRQYRDLQKFEIYLNAISREEKEALILPTEFLSVSEMEKSHPQLVQKRFLLQISQINKNSLLTKVGLKEMWNWEVQDDHWASLNEQFSELMTKKADSQIERLSVLDSLDADTRSKIDNIARKAIVDAHPEWLEDALSRAESSVKEVSVRTSGGKFFIPELKDRKELIDFLEATSPHTQNIQLQRFTADGENFYRLLILDKIDQNEIVTFAEANREGILDELLDKELEAHYAKLRDKKPEEFKTDKGWKPLSDVKETVANDYFADTLKEIKKSAGNTKKTMNGDLSAAYRFVSYMEGLKNELSKGETKISSLLLEKREAKDKEMKLSPRKDLIDQWKIEKNEWNTKRSEPFKMMNNEDLFVLKIGEWSTLQTPSDGNLFFIHVTEKKSPIDHLYDSITKGHVLLSDSAKRAYMQKILQSFRDQKAISLEYLDLVVQPEEH